MTQPPRENEDPAAVQDDLLDQVLREGLTSAGGGDLAAEIQRSRKLLTVLFNQCVLRPPEDVTQTHLERTHLTLSILARQSTQNPELLVADEPFYTFLITRLVIAAARTEAAETPRPELVEAFVAAAVRILRTMAGDVSDHGETYMRGPPRVAHALRDMVNYVHGRYQCYVT
jgi:hypothetical protein